MLYGKEKVADEYHLGFLIWQKCYSEYNVSFLTLMNTKNCYEHHCMSCRGKDGLNQTRLLSAYQELVIQSSAPAR